MRKFQGCQFGLCGSTGASPPQSSSPGQVDIVLGKVHANTSPVLPVTQFYYSGGILLSNSAGLPQMTLPPFIDKNGSPMPFGSQVLSPAPGITTQPTVGLWLETNTVFDTNLDAVYPYTHVYNFSVLTTTNLAGSWNELCTIVGWANANPTVPLACYITYTNSVALSTNWVQAYLDNYGQLTNLTVYGNLPNITSTANSTIFTPNALKVKPLGVPTPPGGGTGTNTGGPFESFPQFFKLTCNTNAISTSWSGS